MFFTRPNIEPLGWDFKEFLGTGAFSFDGITTDDQNVHVKYRSSFIQVWKDDPDGTRADGKPDLVAQIGPPYHGYMLPEQVCDVLGFTINGQKPILSEEDRLQAAEYEGILDWSGQTTYWESWHYLFDNDVRLLIDDISKTFSDMCLVQLKFVRGGQNSQKRKCQKIDCYKDSDSDTTVGIGINRQQLDKIFSADHVLLQDVDRAFIHKIELHCIDLPNGPHNAIYGKPFIDGAGGGKLNLKYETQYPRKFKIQTHFQTHDREGQAFMDALLSILNRHFFNKWKIINLQTKEVLRPCEENNLLSYSMSQREWCLADPDRYLNVGVETPVTRLSAKEALGKDGETVFYGWRPI